MSQNQPQSSSGLGLKIGGVIVVALVGILYFAFAGSKPPSSAEPQPPPKVDLPETRPNNAAPAKPARPADMQLPGEPDAGDEKQIKEHGRLAATPMKRLGGQPGITNMPRPPRPTGENNLEPADGDDAEPEDLPTLKQMALADADPERRLTAVTLLGVSENPDAIPILQQALSDPEEDVRMEAVLALADFTDEAPVQALEIALSDPSADVRYEALDVLSDIETPEAYQAIKRALDDPDDDVRELAELLSELYAEEDYAK